MKKLILFTVLCFGFLVKAQKSEKLRVGEKIPFSRIVLLNQDNKPTNIDLPNGKNTTVLSIDGEYYLVKHGSHVVEIYKCEFDFVKRTKKGRDLAIQWNIKNAEERIGRLGKDITRARRDLKKYKEM